MTKLFRLLLLQIIFCQLFFSGTANAQAQHELLLFLSTEGIYHYQKTGKDLDDLDYVLAADILYSFSYDRFRLLTEFNASNKEHELERFHLGWQIGEESNLLIGRFHVPSNFWISEYHHGQYLQTSISRPGLGVFEDFGAIVASHSTGGLFETGHIFDDLSGFKGAFSIGTAPLLGNDGLLEPLDLLDPDNGHHLAYHFRFSYLPDYFKDNKIGVVASYADINTENQVVLRNSLVDDVEQFKIGAFFNWQYENWRFLGTVSQIFNRVKRRAGILDGSFTNGYVQTEYEINTHWTVFGRLEESFSEKKSAYLELLPKFVTSRYMAGVRFDFLEKHAITLEVSRVENLAHDFAQVRLQWSTVLP